MDKCIECGIELNEDNCSYQEDVCDDCFEKLCDEEITKNKD